VIGLSLVDWQVEVKKAEPRDLRLVADSSMAAAMPTFIVAPSFLPGPIAALPAPGNGLLPGSGPWCPANGNSGLSFSGIGRFRPCSHRHEFEYSHTGSSKHEFLSILMAIVHIDTTMGHL